MEPVDLYAMFLLGVFGTGHCIGMCGPLVVALPGRTGNVAAHGLYHAGRILTYTLLGGIMAGAGSGLAAAANAAGADPMIWMARLQILFSVAAAVLLLLFGLIRIGILHEPDWLTPAVLERLPGFRLMANPGSPSTPLRFFPVGLALGFLPCGLSYAAFARALAAGRPMDGALLALVFGVGTLPGLLFVGAGASSLARQYRKPSDLISGMLMFAMALALLADVLGALAAG